MKSPTEVKQEVRSKDVTGYFNNIVRELRIEDRSASNSLFVSKDMTWWFVFHFEKRPFFILFCFLGFFENSNAKNVRKALYLLCFALNVVINTNCLMKFDSNASNMQIWFDKGGFVWWKVCSRTNFIKQRQLWYFFFFSKFFEIMVHLKFIKHFIKHASLMIFYEVFDAFSSACSSEPFSQTGPVLAKRLNVCCWFESCCSHLNFRYHACFDQGAPWHSASYRV